MVITYHFLESAAWKALSPAAAVLFLEIRRRYNGFNNGDISLSSREAAEVAHCGKGTACRKLTELVECGFVKEASKGQFRNRHASTWVLTTEPYGKELATNEWKNYSKIKTPYP